ncbi:stage V sporulation protein AD [Mangrovibacillus cuniculi]|uniref:Stage V sporulation protein AD n=1 Tax=Mangrovibacillus cuniculi TaxID=2593652 RepID=A0A7S8HEQ2_9BACI|nr:stage V sporulation protein AD [Mangrovibacillus cuniculi]QPC46099.1 stage V sporulation protein AD [Mangrovibacillus cuniculi]
MNRQVGTWFFPSRPSILSTGVVGGPFEKKSPLASHFDHFYDDLWMGQETYEKAHRELIEAAVHYSLDKINKQESEMDIFLSGDLINQITPSSFAARTNAIPYLGLFGACSTSMEGLAMAALLVDREAGKYALTGAGSHNSAVEKQFRYPTEYGGQKPPTAQWTVTGAGYAVVGKNETTEKLPCVTSATIGKVIDLGLTDPFNMGGAMAPAAADTIERHLKNTGTTVEDYDVIFTGDLATIGRKTAMHLLHEKGIAVKEETFKDCGLLIYRAEEAPVQSGASGPGCSATVLYGYILNEMKKGTWKKILLCATGALLSPVTFQQNESIPCIAHAVTIEI